MKENPIARELVKMAHALEEETEYLKLGGDGDPGEAVIELLSEVIDREEAAGRRRLAWVPLIGDAIR